MIIYTRFLPVGALLGALPTFTTFCFTGKVLLGWIGICTLIPLVELAYKEHKGARR